MEKLNFSIAIHAPKEKIYNTMLQDKSYRIWTETFGAGSHYVGNWTTGSKILFLVPNKEGKMEGMVSRIKENRKYDFVSIEHLGIVSDGKEDTTSDVVKPWAGSLENYTFIEKNGQTEVIVEMDITEEYKSMFNDMWPRALQKLKEISEK